ncbi:hypothetical protein IEQ44_11905 [Nocardioides sp. Y6]|uniref:ESX-1 secretion-associated protein n=1 Tax=Nocardioides malaquae TaxID=2773426 RepID=A0ABR9RUX0_9ACTN|nr:hypothetical protein [Nocardioides malaquae]MBE7325359.1 hypothetical protein [Nocardioides malaquae]
MILEVDGDRLRALAGAWEETGDSVSAHRTTIASVGSGGQDFGRLNQFLTPALLGFVHLATRAAERCGDTWQQGALAARDTANDIHLVDLEVARALGGGR